MNTIVPKMRLVSKFGNEIIESLRGRLEKLEQAAAFAARFKDGQSTPTLETMLKKTADKPACLEMFRELAEEEPATQIRRQTVVILLQQKILELKKAVAAMGEAGF